MWILSPDGVGSASGLCGILGDWEAQWIHGGPWALTGWAAQLAGGVVEELQSLCCEQ